MKPETQEIKMNLRRQDVPIRQVNITGYFLFLLLWTDWLKSGGQE